MKKQIIFLFIASIIVGCSTVNTVPHGERYYPTGYDFTDYTERGFLFTPESYLDEYNSVGIIRINHTPQFVHVVQEQARQHISGFRIYRDPNGRGYWRVSEPDTDVLIEKAYETARAMGADAIINFQISSDRYENGNLTVSTATLTGFAIKRID